MHHRNDPNNRKTINQAVKDHPPKSGQHPEQQPRKLDKIGALRQPLQSHIKQSPTCPQRTSTPALLCHAHPGNWPRINRATDQQQDRTAAPPPAPSQCKMG